MDPEYVNPETGTKWFVFDHVRLAKIRARIDKTIAGICKCIFKNKSANKKLYDLKCEVKLGPTYSIKWGRNTMSVCHKIEPKYRRTV